MRFSPALLLFSWPNTGPKSRIISRAQPKKGGSRVQIRRAPRHGPSDFAPLAELFEDRACVRDLRSDMDPENSAYSRSPELSESYPRAILLAISRAVAIDGM